MKILNLGSLNFDKVYELDHFVTAGETILSRGFQVFLGGKGLNQSIALARAGAEVYHAGAIGPDGCPLRKCLTDAGVDDRYLLETATPSGHAIIQNVNGQNCIIVCGGANQEITSGQIRETLSHFSKGDLLLVQNETSNVAFAMEEARRLGLGIAFNASPITRELFDYPLDLVDYFLINEIEGKALSGAESQNYEDILTALSDRFPNAAIVLTVGERGVLYQDRHLRAQHGSYHVSVADTTAAGDTFCGYFLTCLAKGFSVDAALATACKASAIAVSRHGAANSIPTWAEVEKFA